YECHLQTCRDISLDDPLGLRGSPLSIPCTDFPRNRRGCGGEFRYSRRRSQSLRSPKGHAPRAAILELQTSRRFVDSRSRGSRTRCCSAGSLSNVRGAVQTVLGGEDFSSGSCVTTEDRLFERHAVRAFDRAPWRYCVCGLTEHTSGRQGTPRGRALAR